MQITAYIVDFPHPSYRFAALIDGMSHFWQGQGVTPVEAVKTSAEAIIIAAAPRVRSAPGLEDVAWSPPGELVPSPEQVLCAQETLRSIERGEPVLVQGYDSPDAAQAMVDEQVREIHGPFAA